MQTLNRPEMPPIATFYRAEQNPKSAPYALFLATDEISIAALCQFQQKIGAKRLIAICPYHQYFDCLAYADNIISCQPTHTKQLIDWLESSRKVFLSIDESDFELGFSTNKYAYFGYFYNAHQNFIEDFKAFIYDFTMYHLPQPNMRYMALNLQLSKNFELENYQQILDTIHNAVDLDVADIFYGVDFCMPDDEYAVFLLLA